MKTPESLETLVDYGIIQEVIRPLMSGKEAQVFVVVSGGVECVAKVYKEANHRTFKHRVEYTEGRKTRNTRDQRAINKRTRHGKKQDEAAWRNAEVDTLYRVRAGGVRVPEPINYVDGVLVMELVRDEEGDPAPRLGDLEFAAEEAYEIYKKLIREVVRMLCAGTIHGDLSEFNVLQGADGPVVIDFPQSIDPSKNPSARKLLLRDVANLHRFLARHAPGQRIKPLGEEMWALYEKNRLSPNTELLGDYVAPTGDTDVSEVLAMIGEANEEEMMRRDARGDDTPLVAPTTFRRVVDFTLPARPQPGARPSPQANAQPDRGRDRPKGPTGRPPEAREPATPAKRRGRRRRRPPGTAASSSESRPDQIEPPAGPAGDRNRTGAPARDSKGPGPVPKRRRRRRQSARGGASTETRGGASNGPSATSGSSKASKDTARANRDRKPGTESPQSTPTSPSPARRRRRSRAPESR